jgi:hypothetical protein
MPPTDRRIAARLLPFSLAAALTACVVAPVGPPAAEPARGQRVSAPTQGQPGLTPQLRPSGAPTGGAEATPSPVPALPAGLTLVGRVLRPDGKPAAGARVTIFRAGSRLIGVDAGTLIGVDAGTLVSDRGSGLIGPDGGTVVSDRGAGLGSAARWLLQAGQPTELTDAAGRFVVRLPEGEGRFNVEAVAEDGLKALQLDVAADRPVSLALERTGTLSGRLQPPPGSTVTDMQGVAIYIPGTSYGARTASDGTFTLTGVPAGLLPLVAEKPGLGSVSVASVSVPAGGAVQLQPLTLQASRPAVTRVTPAVAGAGTRLVVRGTRFGATRGEPFSVTIGGVAAANPVREDDGSITCDVPDTAGNEGVVVTVGGIASDPAPFRRVATLRAVAASPQLGVGQAARLWLEALDPAGQALSLPALTWRAEGPALTVDASGTVKAVSQGFGTIVASTGNARATVTLEAREPGQVDEQLVYLVEGDNGFVAASGQLLLELDGQRERGFVDMRGKTNLAADQGLPGLVAGEAGSWVTAESDRLLRLGPDGQLLPLAGGPGRQPKQDGAGSQAGFGRIWDLRGGPGGELYVLQYVVGTTPRDWSVRHVKADGTVSTIELPDEGSARYQQLAVGPEGALHVLGDRKGPSGATENVLLAWQPGERTWTARPIDLARWPGRWPQDLVVGARGVVLVLIGEGVHRLGADGTLTPLQDPTLAGFPGLAMARTRQGRLAVLHPDMIQVRTVTMPE